MKEVKVRAGNLQAQSGSVRFFSGLIFLFAILTSGQAAAEVIMGEATGIESDAVRMISYRHQEHAWQTSDGATHLMVNRGDLSPGASLGLYSTGDLGDSWTNSISLNNTNSYASSDGVLIGDQLWIAYSSSASSILFAILDYDSVAWRLTAVERVFLSSDESAINPALVVDRAGAVWCAFVTRHNETSDATIHMSRRSPSGEWTDTGLTFGATDNISVERSARPILTPHGIGMVYSVHETLTWASRQDSWPVDEAWDESVLFERSSQDLDPYASHFTIARDGRGDLHMALSELGRLRYFRFIAATQTWQDRLISGDIRATYPQIAINAQTDGIMIWSNNQNGSVRLTQSLNWGGSFSVTDVLMHPFGGGDISYQNPRIEAPSLVTGLAVVVQQYVDGPLQKLLRFQVALATDSAK